MGAGITPQVAARNESKLWRLSIRRDAFILKTEQRLPQPFVKLVGILRIKAEYLVQIGGFLEPMLCE